MTLSLQRGFILCCETTQIRRPKIRKGKHNARWTPRQPVHRLLATGYCPIAIPLCLPTRQQAELGAERGPAEPEGFGGAGLEAADGPHDVGQNERVEALDQVTIELGLV